MSEFGEGEESASVSENDTLGQEDESESSPLSKAPEQKAIKRQRAGGRMPPSDPDIWHKYFWLKPSIWAPFRALAEHHLRQVLTADLEFHPGSGSTVVEDAVVSFFKSYGMSLWPTLKQYRTHLQDQGYFSKGPPIYLQHGTKLNGVEGQKWRAVHGTEEATDDQAIANSMMGLKMQKYFVLLKGLMKREKANNSEADGVASEESILAAMTPQELLAKILRG